jgi:PAS domain S-box-containing protein
MFKKLIEIRNNILLGNRIKMFLATISILILILTLVSIRSVSNINSQVDKINEQDIKSLVKLSGLIENIYGILIESHIVDEKSLNENAIENSVNLDLVNTYLTEYEQSITDQAQRSSYDAFVVEFQNYLNILRDIKSLSIKGNSQLVSKLKSDSEYKSYKKLQSIIKTMMETVVSGLQTNNEQITLLKRKAFIWIYIVSIIAIILVVMLTFYIFKDVRTTMDSLLKNLKVLEQGQIPESMLGVYGNEVGVMSNLTNGLTKNMAKLNKFANDISKGNYSSEYEFAGENDLLGKALVNLRNSLIISKEEDEKRKIDDERRNWTNRGHAIFGEILRQRSRELSQLTDDIIKNLVYYLKSNQGGLFVINDSIDLPKIELISAFAYDRKKFMERSINIGDGLIGTVALERNTVYLKEIPEGYIEIESGLGESSPKFLLIVPLKFEDEILGIVELASFKEFLDYEIKFVEELAQSIASTLLTAKINARTGLLLEESRKQSENLALQEVEARQNIEEMRAAQELAQRREADLSGILLAVDNTLMKGEYELDGTLISVNNRHLQTMGYQLKEIKGKNIEMFIPKDELAHFRKVWANVVAGNPRQLEVKRRTKTGEELWLINQYTPVTDISGRISKILYLAHDITEYKRSEEEIAASKVALEIKETELQQSIKDLENIKNNIKLKDNELRGIYNAINLGQITIELDIDTHIIKVNNILLNVFKITGSDIVGKKFAEVFVSDKSKEQLDSIIEKSLAGNATSLESKYTLSDNSIVWLNEIFTPVLDSKGRIVKILIIANEITYQKEIENFKTSIKAESEKNNIDLSLIEKEIEEKVRKSLIESGELSKGDQSSTLTLDAINQSIPRLITDIDLNIVSVNKRFTELFKYPERELINKHISRIVPANEKDLLTISPDEFVEGKPVEVQIKLQTRDKQVFPVSFNLIPLNIDKKGLEQLVVYITAIDYVQGNNTDAKAVDDKILAKKKELKEISEKIELLKHEKVEKPIQFKDKEESEKLYQNWLAALKKENDVK